jgi:hypothetical protein
VRARLSLTKDCAALISWSQFLWPWLILQQQRRTPNRVRAVHYSCHLQAYRVYRFRLVFALYYLSYIHRDNQRQAYITHSRHQLASLIPYFPSSVHLLHSGRTRCIPELINSAAVSHLSFPAGNGDGRRAILASSSQITSAVFILPYKRKLIHCSISWLCLFLLKFCEPMPRWLDLCWSSDLKIDDTSTVWKVALNTKTPRTGKVLYFYSNPAAAYSIMRLTRRCMFG